jgi:hypothetical protein
MDITNGRLMSIHGSRIVALSTPRFRRGFFYDAWTHGGDTWERYTVPANDCLRIPAAFLEEERRAQSEHVLPNVLLHPL